MDLIESRRQLQGQKREGEKEGIDYNFISKEEFLKGIENSEFIEYQEYERVSGKDYWGSKKEDYNHKNGVIILNPLSLKQIYNKVKCFIIYLNIPDEIREKRLIKRGDDYKEIKRRIKTDNIDFKNIERYCDLVINNEKDVCKYVEVILSLYNKE